MNDETNLIEEARKAGRAYIDSFAGDLKAVCADLRRRAKHEGREIVSLPPKAPQPWHLEKVTAKKKVG
jgi:hypothetical protein